MKKLFITLFLIMFCTNVFSENFGELGEITNLNGLSFCYDAFNELSFKNQEIIITNFESNIPLLDSKYSLINENKISFISLENTQEKLLALVNEDLILLYKNNDEPWIFATNLGRQAEGLYSVSSSKISATSELTEGNTIYSVSNLSNLQLNKPWVEGVKGNGEGEKIIINCRASFIYFFNGYVSYTKPYLYEQNSRPKKIKLTLLDSKEKKELIFDLKDTPNPQKLSLNTFYSGKIELEILEVYSGSKYQDTCINSLLFLTF